MNDRWFVLTVDLIRQKTLKTITNNKIVNSSTYWNGIDEETRKKIKDKIRYKSIQYLYLFSTGLILQKNFGKGFCLYPKDLFLISKIGKPVNQTCVNVNRFIITQTNCVFFD